MMLNSPWIRWEIGHQFFTIYKTNWDRTLLGYGKRNWEPVFYYMQDQLRQNSQNSTTRITSLKGVIHLLYKCEIIWLYHTLNYIRARTLCFDICSRVMQPNNVPWWPTRNCYEYECQITIIYKCMMWCNV